MTNVVMHLCSVPCTKYDEQNVTLEQLLIKPAGNFPSWTFTGWQKSKVKSEHFHFIARKNIGKICVVIFIL